MFHNTVGKHIPGNLKYFLFQMIFQGLWVNIAKDQLFCLLGPNGAGKTTTISCLTGITPMTGGDGKSILLSALSFWFC